VERERLLEALHKRPGGASVQLLQLAVDLEQGLEHGLEQGFLGLRIGRQRPGALELPAIGVLIAFVEITDYVFALVPLTPLHHGILAKDVPYRMAL